MPVTREDDALRVDDEREVRIQVEPNRYAVVRINPDTRSIVVELPGNYDARTVYMVSDGDANLGGHILRGVERKGKVLGTVLKAKRNLRRVGSPKRRPKRAAR